MNITRVSADFSVSSQIAPSDIPAIAAEGYRSIICNRPDGEEPGQPVYAAVAAAAEQAGLAVRFIPVVPGQATAQDVAAMTDAMRDLPGPQLAYCRSGARSAALCSAALQQAR